MPSCTTIPSLLVLLVVLTEVTNAFFGGGFGFGDCCCCDCCCDCCGCGCFGPMFGGYPFGGYNSFGLYGGAFGGFGKRRRKRQEFEVKKEELYAPTGPKSADFVNNHRCAEPIWLTLLERKRQEDGKIDPKVELAKELQPGPSKPPVRSKTIGEADRRKKKQSRNRRSGGGIQTMDPIPGKAE